MAKRQPSNIPIHTLFETRKRKRDGDEERNIKKQIIDLFIVVIDEFIYWINSISNER